MNADGDIAIGTSCTFSGEPTNALSVVEVDMECGFSCVDCSSGDM